MPDSGTQPRPGPVGPAGSREPGAELPAALQSPGALESSGVVDSPGVVESPLVVEPPLVVESSRLLDSLRRLTDAELVERVEALARREHGDTALLVAHLAELDTRDWFLRAGYSSLFTYCRDALALSEHESYNRIEVARAARRYPFILELLASGAVNLTTVRLLSPHLTPDNHATVLESARGKKRPEVEEIVARLAPFPEVPPSIRKLPPPRAGGPPPAPPASEGIGPGSARPLQSTGSPFGPPAGAPTTGSTAPAWRPAGSPAAEAAGRSQDRPSTAPTAVVVPTTIPPPAYPPPEYRRLRSADVTPIAPDRYRLQCTIGGATLEKLRLAQDMLRHAIPSGDEAAILDRAFTALLVEIARARFAAVDNPQPARGTAPGSRHVPAEVKRAVWVRDLGRCAFVGTDGRRCNERAFVEFHHVRPYAAGGTATVENIQLRCRRHNGYEARTFFDKGRDADDTGVLREPRAAYGERAAATIASPGEVAGTATLAGPEQLVSERVRMPASSGSGAQARRERTIEAGADAGANRPPPRP
jgi:hypothetical protein